MFFTLRKSEKISQYRPAICLAGIFLVALFFIGNGWLHKGTLWTDEIFTVLFAQPNNSWSDFFNYLLLENSPPIYYLLLMLWFKVFGSSDFFGILFSVLVHLFSLSAIYFLGKEIFSKKVGVLAACLTGISTFMTFYALEVRMYSLVFFLAVLSLLFFWRYLKNKKWLDLFLYFLCTLFLVNTHLQGWFLILAQDVFLFFNLIKPPKEKSRSLFRFFWAQLIILEISLVWLIPFVITKIYRLKQGWYFVMNYFNLDFFSRLLNHFLIFNQNSDLLELASLGLKVIIFFLIIYSFVKIRYDAIQKSFNLRPQISEGLKFIFIIFLTLLTCFFLIYLAVNFYLPKYFIIAAVPFYLLLAQGLANLKSDKPLVFFIIFVLIIFIVGGNNFLLYSQDYLRVNWDQVDRFIRQNEKPGDKIILSNFFREIVLDKYYQGRLPVEGFYPVINNKDKLNKLVTDNWTFLIDKNNVGLIKDSVSGCKRVFFIQDNVTDPDNLMIYWFLSHDWNLIFKKNFTTGAASAEIELPIVVVFSRDSAESIGPSGF